MPDKPNVLLICADHWGGMLTRPPRRIPGPRRKSEPAEPRNRYRTLRDGTSGGVSNPVSTITLEVVTCEAGWRMLLRPLPVSAGPIVRRVRRG